jgi:putative transposase
MHVMPSHPYEREHTMTQEKSRAAHGTVKELIAENKDFLREIVRETMQQLLEAEMNETVDAEPGERT